MLLVVIFAAFVIFHGIRSEDLSTGISMAAEDLNVVARCPTDLSTVKTFVTRTKSEGDRLRTIKRLELDYAATIGYEPYDWPERICTLGWPAALDLD